MSAPSAPPTAAPATGGTAVHPAPSRAWSVLALAVLALTIAGLASYCSSGSDDEVIEAPTTPAMRLAAEQYSDPKRPWCVMPCSILIYGRFKPLPPKGVWWTVVVPMEGTKTYTFRFDPQGNFVDEENKPKPDDLKVWQEQMGGGWYHFSAPETPGLTMSVDLLGG